jgi:serine/threonine-protein kinase
MSVRLGQTLHGKWRLDSFIGRGGSADVYAATHRNGKRAAVKILHPQYAAEPELLKRFLREGYVANSLAHPGAVSVLDDDRCEDGAAYLVMELLEGTPLSDFSKKKTPLAVGLVLRIADDVLDVLAAAHERGIIHRDIKPGNLFLTHEGRTKVLDFGIARLLEPDGGEPMTLSGTSLGTPAYMAPEQARGRWELVDGRTDLWALGATLIALLTGRKPRKADTANEELLFAMTQPIPPFASFAPGAPAELCALVDRAVAYERDQRFANAREMQTYVRAAMAQLAPILPNVLDVTGDASVPGWKSNTVNMNPSSSSHGGSRTGTPLPVAASLAPSPPSQAPEATQNLAAPGFSSGAYGALPSAPSVPAFSTQAASDVSSSHVAPVQVSAPVSQAVPAAPSTKGRGLYVALAVVPLVLLVALGAGYFARKRHADAAAASAPASAATLSQAPVAAISASSTGSSAAATPPPEGSVAAQASPSVSAVIASASASSGSAAPAPVASTSASAARAGARPPAGTKPGTGAATKKPECTDIFSCRNE